MTTRLLRARESSTHSVYFFCIAAPADSWSNLISQLAAALLSGCLMPADDDSLF